MTVNKNIYPDVNVLENVIFTKPITEITDFSEYLEKSIFYAGCNTDYMSFVPTDSISRENTEEGLKHTFKKASPTKHDLCMSVSDYTGGLYGYYGDEHDQGWHGAINTLINHFDFTKCYIDLDDLYINTISLEHANMTGSDAVYQNDTHQYHISEYLLLENKPPIMSWSSILVKGVPDVNIYPLFCYKTDFYSAYTPTNISYRSNSYMYVSDGAYGGVSANPKYYAVQTDWNNQSNTSILFYDADSQQLSGNAVIGLPNDCEIITPIGQGETEYNYFIPDGYDYKESPMPCLYYWSNWQTYYFNVYSFEYFLKMVASTGLRFKLNNVMYASEIGSDGYTTGRYIPVSELPNSDFANKDWINSESSNYDADKKPEQDIENELKNIGLNDNVGNSHFVKWYILTETEMTALENWLSSSNRPTGYRPLESFVGVSEYPFDLVENRVCSSFTDNYVKIGTENYDSPLNRMIQIRRVIDLGSYKIDRYNNDFTDYAPYSTYKLYIPFCGWVELDSDICVDETIDVKLIVDPISTSCKGVVLVRGNIIAETNGTCGNNIPISSNNMGMQRQALLNAGLGIMGSVGAVATGALTGNTLATTGGILGAVGSISQALSNSHTNYSSVKGTTGTATNYNTYKQCVIQITHPVEIIPHNYGHTIGYITNKTKILSNCSGYVVCDNVDIKGLSCDYSAKQRIKNLLETGVYI